MGEGRGCARPPAPAIVGVTRPAASIVERDSGGNQVKMRVIAMFCIHQNLVQRHSEQSRRDINDLRHLLHLRTFRNGANDRAIAEMLQQVIHRQSTHRSACLDSAAAHMRQQNRIGQIAQRLGDFGFLLKHV